MFRKPTSCLQVLWASGLPASSVSRPDGIWLDVEVSMATKSEQTTDTRVGQARWTAAGSSVWLPDGKSVASCMVWNVADYLTFCVYHRENYQSSTWDLSEKEELCPPQISWVLCLKMSIASPLMQPGVDRYYILTGQGTCIIPDSYTFYFVISATGYKWS